MTEKELADEKSSRDRQVQGRPGLERRHRAGDRRGASTTVSASTYLDEFPGLVAAVTAGAGGRGASRGSSSPDAFTIVSAGTFGKSTAELMPTADMPAGRDRIAPRRLPFREDLNTANRFAAGPARPRRRTASISRNEAPFAARVRRPTGGPISARGSTPSRRPSGCAPTARECWA